jgi:hypothetical protein
MPQQKERYTDKVREFARDKYIEPARKRGEKIVSIVSGDVYRPLGVTNVVPSVCNALRSKKFLVENNLILESVEGPPSGLGTRVIFHYKFSEFATSTSRQSSHVNFMRLRGLGKKTFAALGGGVDFLLKERREFRDASDRISDTGTKR